MKIIKSILIAATLASLNTTVLAQNANDNATNDYTTQVAVAKASRAWKDAFNAGDAAAATALYEDDAVMVVTPFGTYTGKKEILAFWTDLIQKGFDDVVYSDTSTTIVSAKSARVAANWKMNKASGIITNELWVVQPDGQALLRLDHFEVAQ